MTGANDAPTETFYKQVKERKKNLDIF